MASVKRTKRFGSTVEQAHTFRVAVFGQTGVGKTALIVRFVTEKFIGEYDPSLEMIYQRLLVLSPTSELVFFEIIDTLDQKDENPEILNEKIKWADAFVLVFSTTDQQSFKHLQRLRNLIWNTINGNVCCEKVNQELPLVLVGNKNELQSQRLVSPEEGIKVAKEFKCPYFEISVRESVEEAADVFTALYESHKKILKSGFGRRRSDYGPHIDIPMMPHHLPLLSTLHKHKSFKYVDKLKRMQGCAGIESVVSTKQLKKRTVSKEFSTRRIFGKSYEESKSQIPTVFERHLEEHKVYKRRTLDDANCKSPASTSTEEANHSAYDNSSSDESCCEQNGHNLLKVR